MSLEGIVTISFLLLVIFGDASDAEKKYFISFFKIDNVAQLTMQCNAYHNGFGTDRRWKAQSLKTKEKICVTRL